MSKIGKFFKAITTIPKSLKDISDWLKFLGYCAVAGGLIGGALGLIMGFADDTRTGVWTGITTALLTYFAWLMYVFYELTAVPCRNARDAVTVPSQDLKTELDHASTYVRWLIVVASLLALGTCVLAWLKWFPSRVSDLQPAPPQLELRREVPSRLTAELASYFNPARDLVNPKFPDFVLRLIERLIKEGNATMKPSEVAILQTAPLEHAAPAMTLTIPSESAIRALSPIAFLVTTHEGRRKYEQVAVEYPDSARILIRLPAASVGDRILIISRVTSLEKGAHFPADVADLLKFTSIQGD